MKVKESMWKEIRAEHLDEDTGILYVDAWFTDDDNEDGEVIAKIDADANIEYLEDAARDDSLVQEVIKEARFNILAEKAYALYIDDWCKERGYNPDNRDPENGFDGEDYVCFDEFAECEFRDLEYVMYLLNEKDFETYKEIIEEEIVNG